jgi:hypothetical protein
MVGSFYVDRMLPSGTFLQNVFHLMQFDGKMICHADDMLGDEEFEFLDVLASYCVVAV